MPCHFVRINIFLVSGFCYLWCHITTFELSGDRESESMQERKQERGREGQMKREFHAQCRDSNATLLGVDTGRGSNIFTE